MQMPKLARLMMGVMGALVLPGCAASPDGNAMQPTAAPPPAHVELDRSAITPELQPVGSQGWYNLAGPFASFDPNHPSVEIWTPEGAPRAPVVVYAHGGAGYREDDRARVEMFRRNGFATISFDAYEMNGFDDWHFVTRRVSNPGKQSMIWGVFEGAVEHAANGHRWDSDNVFLYGGSNGGRVVLYAGAVLQSDCIRGIVSEAPAATGFPLGDLYIPTIIPFGALDTWAGRSTTDYVWTRTYPNSPLISLEQWVANQKAEGRDVDFIFYENAGHSLFEGPLQEVTVERGNSGSFTAYEGAGEGVLDRYERDVIGFVNRHVSRESCN